MKKKMLIGICIILIIIILVSSISYYFFSKKEIIEYKINIKTNSNSSYILYLPLLDSIDEVGDFNKIKGIGEFNIINSEYGKCLKIKSNNNLTFNYKEENINFGFEIGLTMNNQTKSYWIYFENPTNQSFDINLEIQFKRYFSNKTTIIKIETNLLQGWNSYTTTISKK